MRQENKEQGSGEWFNQRIGKLTASRMWDAMSYTKKGTDSSERMRLKMEIVTERMTDIIMPKYVNAAMQWGIDNEPLAKQKFENETGILIKDVGFVPHPTIENFGASPDGFTSDGFLIETKCPTSITHFKYLLDKENIPAEYKPQMCVQALCSGRKKIWFVSCDPRFPPKQQMFIKLYEPTQKELDDVEAAAIKFLAEVDELFDNVMGA
jgi:putative phage-type endonuclease